MDQSTPLPQVLDQENRALMAQAAAQEMHHVHHDAVEKKRSMWNCIWEFDYKSVVAVFLIVFLVTSSVVASGLRSTVPAAFVEGGARMNVVGSLILAVFATILFAVFKILTGT